MRGLRHGKFVALGAVVALAAAACGGSSGGGGNNAGSVSKGGTFSVYIVEPQYLIPANTNETSGSQVDAGLFTPLVDYDQKTNAPHDTELTDSIKSSDQKVWDIKIKSGWKFHDGTPVTSDSFIDAWNFAAYGPNGQNNNYFFALIDGYCDVNPGGTDENGNTCPGDAKTTTPTTKTLKGLEKVSDTEFKVTLIAPNNTFYTRLGYTGFYPMPKKFIDGDDAAKKAFEQAPIGNGPFQMDGTWTHDQSIKVKKYADYKGTKPNADAVDFKIYQQDTTAYSDLQADNLDVMDTVPTDSLATVATDLGDRYIQIPSSYYGFLGFPTFDTKYSKKEVRQAISMAIDRKEITTKIFNNTRTPADDFVSPVVNGYRKGACGDACKFDAAKAKQMLQAAGGIEGNSMTITYNADGGHKDWVDAACNQIKANLGVDCVGVPKPKFAQLLNDLDKAKTAKTGFGPFRLAWIMDYPSMQDYLGPLYGTTGSSNYYGYSSTEFDQLVGKGVGEAKEADAIKDWQKADDILVKDLPVVPLFFGQLNGAVSKKVKDVQFDAFQRVNLVKVQVVK